MGGTDDVDANLKPVKEVLTHLFSNIIWLLKFYFFKLIYFNFDKWLKLDLNFYSYLLQKVQNFWADSDYLGKIFNV